MKTYMIGYDLSRPHQDYAKLIEAIKSYANWWHCLDSTWLIKTGQTATQIRDYLRQYIDNNDELLVAGLTGESAWAGFNEECSTWLKNSISST
jgi:hypothetical protein